VAVRQPYIRVVGLDESTDGNARGNLNFTAAEEAAFKAFAAQPNVLGVIREKIAPAIFGVDDVKAAVACLLFGGARKHLPDGVRLRGDVNVLMLGDPSTAKSQVRVCPHQHLPDGVRLRGDVNVLMLGDPSTAKSQVRVCPHQRALGLGDRAGKGRGRVHPGLGDRFTGQADPATRPQVVAGGQVLMMSRFSRQY
jgi:DNA replicative helicase MCM subunit Mcm2 (Cdc46/Mcm family)